MNPIIIIGLLFGAPLLLGLFLRVHTSALFLSISGGYLLSEYFSTTAGLVSRSFLKTSESAMVAEMVVFYLPIVVTLWLMRGSLAARQMAAHFLPLVGCALIVLVAGVGLLSTDTQLLIYATAPGEILQNMPDILVGFAVLAQLVLMWATARPQRG
jgi:hypothetical protein